MPITQDRMKLLIDAAQSVVATHLGQCGMIAEQVVEFRAGKIGLEGLLEWLENRNLRPDVAIASEMVVINREHYRWIATHSKNEQEARRMARRRAGLPTRRAVYVHDSADDIGSVSDPRVIAENERVLKERMEQARLVGTTATTEQPKIIRKFVNTDSKQVNADSELEFGESASDGTDVDVPADYVPKELSDDDKARIERETAEIKARLEYEEKYGVGK